MSASSNNGGLGRYLESRHHDLAGWFADAMVGLFSAAPGFPGLAVRALWNRLWIKGGPAAVESTARLLGVKFITLGRGVYIGHGAYLHGRPGGLRIGDGTRIMDGAVLHVHNFRALAQSNIEIGQGCVIGFGSIITGQGGVTIGDDVIVAPRAMVLPVDHIHADPIAPIREQGITARGIQIKRGAWIGAGAIILDGVTVGENAVVGAGAVVTADVPDHATVAGNPARPLNSDSEGNKK